MGTSIAILLSDYLATTYSPDCEWLDGEVRERNVGEGAHAVIQKFLTVYLGNREDLWDILVLAEQRVQTSANHFRVPDVCVVQGDAPFEPIVKNPPLLCIEILSREDSMSEMYERVEDYHAMGVRGIWLIDPRRRKAFTFERGVLLPAAQQLSLAGTPLRVSIDDLFRQLNRLEGRS